MQYLDYNNLAGLLTIRNGYSTAECLEPWVHMLQRLGGVLEKESGGKKSHKWIIEHLGAQGVCSYITWACWAGTHAGNHQGVMPVWRM